VAIRKRTSAPIPPPPTPAEELPGSGTSVSQTDLQEAPRPATGEMEVDDGLLVDVPASPTRAGRWIRDHPVGLGVAGLIVVQLIWRAQIFASSFFGGDDFLYQSRAHQLGLSWKLLAANYNGQLLPGVFGLAWLDESVAPLSWGFVVAQTLLLQALAALAFWHLLTTVFGRRAALLLPLALYLASPLTLPSNTWWAASLSAIPLQISLCMAVASHVRHLRSHSTLSAIVTAAWMALGLCFFSRAALLPVGLVGLSIALLPRTGVRRSLTWVLRRYPLAWSMQLLVLGGYALAYALAPRDSASQGVSLPDSFADLLRFFQNGLTRSLAPGLVGGPWRWIGPDSPSALADPRFLAAWIAGLLLLVLIAVTAACRRRGLGMWVVAMVYVLSDLTLTSLGRPNLLGGSLSLETHYVTDAVPLLYLTVTFMFLPVRGEGGIAHQRATLTRFATPLRATTGLLAATLGLLSSAAYSTHTFTTERSSREPARTYIETARSQLAAAPADLRLYDRLVPGTVMNGLFGSAAKTSAVFSPALSTGAERQLFAPYPEHPYLLSETGRLTLLRLRGVSTLPGPTPGCGYLVKADPVDLSLGTPIFDYAWTARLGYLSSKEGSVRVLAGGRAVVVPVHQGLHQAYFPLRAKGGQVTLQVLTPGVGLCVDRVDIGQPATTP
jgi:hypothetical protein